MNIIKEYGKMFTWLLLVLTYMMVVIPPVIDAKIHALCFFATFTLILTIVSKNIRVSNISIGFAWLLIVYYCIEIYKYAEILQLKASPLVT